MDNESTVGSKTVGSGVGSIRRIINIIIVVAAVEIYII
jgi:hypothetical protein